MERLIAFGCSLTYGHGLPDCFSPPDGPGPTPSKFAWPALIADQLGRKCINNASPGASNKRIWHTVINFNFKESDIVFIQWTYMERTSIIKRDSIINIGNWTGHDCYYDSIYDEFDSKLITELYIDHTNRYLKSKNITVYNLIPENFKCNMPKSSYIPIFMNYISEYYPLALDSNHPGASCHEAYSKSILDYLKIKNNLTDNKNKKIPLIHNIFIMFQQLKQSIKIFNRTW